MKKYIFHPACSIFIYLYSFTSTTMAGDDFSSATLLSGTSASDAQSNQNATTEAGEPEYTINNTVFRSLWWKWTPPSDGRATFSLVGSDETSGGSSFGKILGVYVAKSATPDVSSLASVRASGSQTTTDPSFSLPVRSGTTYYLHASSYSSGRFGVIQANVALDSSTDINNLNVQGSGNLTNDAFANRVTLSGENVSAISYTGSATAEPSDTSLGFRTVWWQWQAPRNGRATFTTVGSDEFSGSSGWSKYLGVFLGSDISDLRLCSRALARFPATTIPVTAGQVYQIGIGSDTADEAGTLVLSVDLATDTDINALNIGPRASAANDLFGNRVRLTGQFISTVGYGNYAGIEALEPVNAGYGTLWWTYTAPASGTVSLSTAGSSTADNKYVSVWTGGSLPGLSQVIRSSSAKNPSVSFAATQGTTYQIAVGAASSSDTAGTVVLSLAGPPGAVDPPVTGLVVDKAVRLRWPTELNVSYRVRGSTDLMNWSNIGPAYVGTGDVMETFQVALPDAKFFQVYSP